MHHKASPTGQPVAGLLRGAWQTAPRTAHAVRFQLASLLAKQLLIQFAVSSGCQLCLRCCSYLLEKDWPKKRGRQWECGVPVGALRIVRSLSDLHRLIAALKGVRGFGEKQCVSFCACRRSTSWAIVTLLVRFMVICYTNLCPV